MIVVDASAILAIVLKEPEADSIEAALAAAGQGVMSAVNYWEVLVRASGVFGPAGSVTAKAVMARLGVRVEAASVQDAEDAMRAFERFGKRSAGRLNLGDCFAYALADREGDGLLFKGNDFSKTDIKSVVI